MDTSTLLAISVALVVGLLVGIVLTRALSSPLKQRKQLGEELRQAREKQELYERDIAEHFVTTSSLVNNLTESYRNLHQHLATSAETLVSPELNHDLLAPSTSQLELDIGQLPALDTDTPEPPKDYAPSQGVLNESYGLDSQSSLATNARITGQDKEKDKPQLSVVARDAGDATDSAATLTRDDNDDPTLKVG